MSQSKLKRKRHAQVRAECPMCIYCGGVTVATTVDHMPPIGMFDGRQRPKGLEFASCESCNQGTKKAELVACLLGRVFPDAITQLQIEDLQKQFEGIRNNILEEMHIGEEGQAEQRKLLQIGNPGGFLRANGPLVSKHMQPFAIKLGFALHYHATETIVPLEGGVAARWFSNVDRLTDRFPQRIFKLLPPPETLKQGSVGVADQFQFSFTYAADRSIGLYLGTFRPSFSVVAFAANRKSLLTDAAPDAEGFRVYEPGEILV